MILKKRSKTPICSICNEPTNDPIYIGKLRCKSDLLEQYKTVSECVTHMAKMHLIQCKQHREREERARNEILVDIIDKYTPCDCPREMN